MQYENVKKKKKRERERKKERRYNNKKVSNRKQVFTILKTNDFKDQTVILPSA
jgi:hypothetical protein